MGSQLIYQITYQISHKIFTMYTQQWPKQHSPKISSFFCLIQDSLKPTGVLLFMRSALNQSELETNYWAHKNTGILSHLASSCLAGLMTSQHMYSRLRSLNKKLTPKILPSLCRIQDRVPHAAGCTFTHNSTNLSLKMKRRQATEYMLHMKMFSVACL